MGGVDVYRPHFDSKHHNQHTNHHNYHTRHHSASPLLCPHDSSSSSVGGSISPQPVVSDTAPDAPPKRRLKFLSGLSRSVGPPHVDRFP